MSRLLFILLLISLKGHAVGCDWTGVEKDNHGCIHFSYWKLAKELKCEDIPKCFKFEIIEVEEKEYFKKESVEERQKIIQILDMYAVTLLKDTKLKNIKIIFYNKNKLSKEFKSEAEEYLTGKGLNKEQFIIELR